MRTRAVAAAGLALAACAVDEGGIGSQDQHDVVADVYEREVAWPAPAACRAYLHQRVVDYVSYHVEYRAELDGDALAIVYGVRPEEARPLAVEVHAAGRGLLLALAADDATLEVAGAGGAPLLAVDGYTTRTADLAAAAPLDPRALAALRCILPARAELGWVPGFLRNRREGAPVGGVGQSSSAAPAVIPWDADLGLIGALARASLCLQPEGWACGCFTLDDPIAGAVTGACP